MIDIYHDFKLWILIKFPVSEISCYFCLCGYSFPATNETSRISGDSKSLSFTKNKTNLTIRISHLPDKCWILSTVNLFSVNNSDHFRINSLALNQLFKTDTTESELHRITDPTGPATKKKTVHKKCDCLFLKYRP